MYICSMLSPEEIQNLYESCEKYKLMMDILKTYYPLEVVCTEIVEDNIVDWFHKNNIRLKLIETYKTRGDCQYYLKNGYLHRDNDQPAVIYGNGTKEWFQYGKRHRDNDLPAIIYGSGTQEWFRNGKRHRDGDLPACTNVIGYRLWYKNNKLHRDGDQPAYIDGYSQEWYQNGKRHRDGDQPAVIYKTGRLQWFEHGRLYKERG